MESENMENLLFILLFTLPIFIPLGFFAFIRFRLSQKGRLPIDYKRMQRVPGFSLIVELKSLQFDMGSFSGLAVAVGMLPFAQAGIFQLFGKIYSTPYFAVMVFITTSTQVYLIYRIIKSFKKLQYVRLGLEAEWAVAGELNQINDPNVTVFHDLQGDNFNIDHVVTSPNGILVIETKGRRKPNKGERNKSFQVEAIENTLHFPHYVDNKTIPQAQRQTKWLKEYLSNAAGESSLVISAIVVVPGWYVTMKTKPEVLTWPLKNLSQNYRNGLKQRLSPEQLQRVNHQLETLSLRNTDLF